MKILGSVANRNSDLSTQVAALGALVLMKVKGNRAMSAFRSARAAAVLLAGIAVPLLVPVLATAAPAGGDTPAGVSPAPEQSILPQLGTGSAAVGTGSAGK